MSLVESPQPTLVFDFDGVICEQTTGDYANAKPYWHAIQQINLAYDLGYHIVILTARYMQRTPGKSYQMGYLEAITWLRKHEVRFHELHFGKPSAIMYVDDRGCRVESAKGMEDWKLFWERLFEITALTRGLTINGNI